MNFIDLKSTCGYANIALMQKVHLSPGRRVERAADAEASEVGRAGRGWDPGGEGGRR